MPFIKIQIMQTRVIIGRICFCLKISWKQTLCQRRDARVLRDSLQTNYYYYLQSHLHLQITFVGFRCKFAFLCLIWGCSHHSHCITYNMCSNRNNLFCFAWHCLVPIGSSRPSWVIVPVIITKFLVWCTADSFVLENLSSNVTPTRVIIVKASVHVVPIRFDQLAGGWVSHPFVPMLASKLPAGFITNAAVAQNCLLSLTLALAIQTRLNNRKTHSYVIRK